MTNSTMSLPSRGAWIEILYPRLTPKDIKSRFPHGERGLKSKYAKYFDSHKVSLPSRGAWIEICWAATTSPGRWSLPSRGAWIEIELLADELENMDVAPLTGSVD